MASEIKANKISPATGTDFTLGDSGDTFTVPSGATLSGAGSITVPSGGTLDVSSATMTGFTIPSGQTLTIDSGGTIANNGTSSGFTSSTAAGEVKAWCFFNGSGSVSITASSNVSSLTDRGTGDYSINLINAMANSNYVYAGSVNRGATVGVLDSGGTAASGRSASSPRINTWYVSEVKSDFTNILVTFFNT